MSTYTEIKKRQQEEFDKFPLGFAFSNAQFVEMMKNWGLSPEDTDKICRIPAGGFIQKKDVVAFMEMNRRHKQEKKEAVEADVTGNGYIFQMFYYELKNHEYGYTGDAEDTLDALGYTCEDIQADKRLLHGFEKAKRKIMKEEGGF